MTISLAVPDILVARAKSGDLEALEALYRAFETPVYNLALRVLRVPEDAEDVLQETFLDRVRETEELHEESAVAARAVGGLAGVSPGAVPAQIDLERAFERLSERSRAVVWLHDVEGYTHEEIAEQMGKTVSFSKSQLARAHARLRRMLDDEGVAP